MRWYHWLWVPIVAVASFLAYSLGRTRKDFKTALDTEVSAVNAKTDAKRLVIEQGTEIARAKIETEHRETINRLTETQKQEASRLRGDPVALSVFLARIGKRAGSGTS